MKIFAFLEEQSTVCFSGRINIVKLDDKSQIGVFLFQEGQLVNAKYGVYSGTKAFAELVGKIEEIGSFDYILEPEIISSDLIKFTKSLSSLRLQLEENSRLIEEMKSQRPPDNIKLMVKPEIFESEEEFTPSEFKLLCTLSDYTLVKDIYRQSDMLEHEITKNLINLRKKSAVKVVETK